jgi:hypothetical protein
VDDPGAPTRVEIELTANDESRTWRRKPGAATTAEPASNGDTSDASVARPDLEPGSATDGYGPPPVERRRLIVAVVIVAVVALFVGWALGRAGGSPDATAQPPQTTIETSGLETLAPASVPTTVPVTTRPVVRARPTTTTAPEWETTTVEVDPVVAALGIRVVVVGGGRIVELDTGSGELHALQIGTRFGQQPLVNAGEDWIVIRNFDTGRFELVRTGELPVGVDIGDPWSALFQRETGLFWRVSSTFLPGEPTDVEEVDHEGTATGRRFEIPFGVWPMAVDPGGGVAAEAPSGVYQVGPDTARRVTTGSVIALSERIAVVTECGDELDSCGLFVLDRASGERRQLAITDSRTGDPIATLAIQSMMYWGAQDLLGAISTDGRWAPAMIQNDREQFGLIDLTTGQFLPVAPNAPTGIWWAPDGRSVIYNQNQRLMLFDTEQRTWTDVVPASVAVQAFAVRP